MTYLRRIILAAVLMAGFSPAFAQVPAPVPALPDTERRASYSISGTTCACAVNFALYGDGTDYQNWVEVFIDGVRYDYNDATHGWTITSPSGSLGSIARPVTNAVLTFNAVQTGTVQIVGARRPRRASQFNENAGVSARNLNQVITDLVAQNRETWDKINDVTGRGFFAPPGQTGGVISGPLSGVISGPATSTDNSFACWNGTSGAALKNCGAATIGPGILSLGGHVTNFNVYPVNTDNGIQLSYGTGAGNGEGGGITFYTKNPTGSGAPIINQELGFTQVSAWNGSAYHATAPPATVYITTEAWNLTNNGAGVLFQAITRGETAARGEVCVAEGLKAMATGATSCQPGLGIGTINAANGIFDNGNRPLSASNLGITLNQNAPTIVGVLNNSTGAAGFASFAPANVNGSTTFGTAGSGYTGFSSLLTNKGVMLTQSTLDGLVLYADGAAKPIQFITNGTERARALLGFMVGTTTDPGAGILNVLTGIRVNNAATSGNVLRGNGTNFVPSAIQSSDIAGLPLTTLTTSVPTTLTGTSGTVGASDTTIIFNPSGTFTVTLPSAVSFPGRWLYVKVIAAQAVNSASSNVVGITGGAPGAGILTGTSGKWATLQSDGSNWVIMANN